MSRKRKAKIITATLPMGAMEALASELDPMFGANSGSGMKLTTKCRLWRRKDGTWTVRFVYANPDDRGLAITTIFRGVVFK